MPDDLSAGFDRISTAIRAASNAEIESVRREEAERTASRELYEAKNDMFFASILDQPESFIGWQRQIVRFADAAKAAGRAEILAEWCKRFSQADLPETPETQRERCAYGRKLAADALMIAVNRENLPEIGHLLCESIERECSDHFREGLGIIAGYVLADCSIAMADAVVRREEARRAAQLAAAKALEQADTESAGVQDGAASPTGSAAADPIQENGKGKKRRNSSSDARDKWIYEECCKGTAYLTIVNKLKTKPKTWDRIDTEQGIRRAAKSYAKKHDLPPIPSRRGK